MTIASDKDSAPRPRSRWSRAAAIEAFGVRYVQRRTWRDPVVEALGAHVTAEEALEGARTFPSESAAIQRVQAEAREEATRELDRCDAFLEARSIRLRLALARTWRFARRREVGVLATASILEQRRREQRSLLRNGVSVSVRRLPDPVRLPHLLDLGALVHVVDTRAVPHKPLRIESRPILALSFVEAPSHPEFDQLVRYRVRGLDGLGHDHARPGAERLSGAPSGVEVFLDMDRADAFVASYAADVLARLGRSDAPLPPVERVVDPVEPPVVPAPTVQTPEAVPPAPAPAASPAEPPVASIAAAPEPDVRPVPTPLGTAASEAGVAAVAAALAFDLPAEPDSDRPSPVSADPSEGAAASQAVPDSVATLEGVVPTRAAPGMTDLDTAESVGSVIDAPAPEAAADVTSEPRLVADEVRTAPAARRGFLARLFGRRARADRDPPLPPEAPREDPLPEQMILDEIETAVIDLAAAAQRTQRPSLPAPPAFDPRHPETSAFLARGDLVLMTSSAEGQETPALRMLALLRPGGLPAGTESAPTAGDAAKADEAGVEEAAGLAA